MNMTSEEPIEQEQTEEKIEQVAVTPVTEGPPPATVIVTTVTASGVQPSSFMTRWHGPQWLAALLALAAPLALMFAIVYVFREELRGVMKAVGL
jgi:hypothetical protein